MKFLFKVDVRANCAPGAVWMTRNVVAEDVPSALSKMKVGAGYFVSGVNLIAQVDHA